MLCRKTLGLFALGAALVLPTGPALAAYPERPITLVVNYPPGGLLDITARLFAEDAGKQLGQAVIVENRAGANGQVGAQHVARQKPDGYTLLLTVDTLYTVNPFIYVKSNFDARKDLSPISMVGSFSQTLLTHPDEKITSFAEFIEKARTEDITYATAGIGAPGHLTMEYLNQKIKGNMIHVPYQGNAPATTGLVSGQTQAGFLAIGGAIQFVESERLVPLAVSSAERDPLMPNVATIQESGLEGLEDFDVEFGFTLMGPKGLSDELKDKWSALIEHAFANPRILDTLQTMNLNPLHTKPVDTQTRLDKVAEQWKTVIEHGNISTD